jgi:hypothetical protein
MRSVPGCGASFHQHRLIIPQFARLTEIGEKAVLVFVK